MQANKKEKSSNMTRTKKFQPQNNIAAKFLIVEIVEFAMRQKLSGS